MSRTEELRRLTEDALEAAGLTQFSITIRSFPGEHIVIIEAQEDTARVIDVANALDSQIPDGFVTVRKPEPGSRAQKKITSVKDKALDSLIQSLQSTSRTSEAQHSVRYIDDIEGRLQNALSKRHHMIFGRRGVGKTALLLRAKQQAEKSADMCVWQNVQAIRNLGPLRAFIEVARALCTLPEQRFGTTKRPKRSVVLAASVLAELESISKEISVIGEEIDLLTPKIQEILRLLTAETGSDIYVFVDDVHYLNPEEIPEFLDRLHAATRDTPTWIKAAGIKHQMRWFNHERRLGLQLGHDASDIDLDVTLEEPARARRFLEAILDSHIAELKTSPRSAFISSNAIDRLVLASGGVPRDFTLLCAGAIQRARKRDNARTAGIQDVNQAAGDSIEIKIRELQEVAASERGNAGPILKALDVVRAFLLDEKRFTFMRIDLRDKETRREEYGLIQSLMEFRLAHLLSGGVSDGQVAGRRQEVYLLDLSQYSGARLKRSIQVLELDKDHLVLKETRSQMKPVHARTARELIGIFRRGPLLPLENLTRLG